MKIPKLGDEVDTWLVARRNADESLEWRSVMDDLIEDYRLHAHLRKPLDEDIHA